MKKKILFAVIAIILVIGLVVGVLIAKHDKTDDVIIENNTETNIENELVYTSKILSEDGEYIAKVSSEETYLQYEVVEKEYKFSENIVLKIPQLKNIREADIAFANPMIEQAIIDQLNMYSENGEITLDNYDYKVTLSDNYFVSIVFSGNINILTAAHPSNFILTLNIDLLTHEIVDTTNVIENREEFVKLLKSENAEYEGVDEVKKYIRKELDNDVLMSEVFETSKKVYFTNEHICTVISVPHAIGDYAVVKLKYSDLK